jgi:tetratricopeptide (TPR) repeat protein
MHQHQYAPLPLNRLPGIPSAVVQIIKRLMEKGPAQRFQTPTDFLAAMENASSSLELSSRIPSGASLRSQETVQRNQAASRPKSTEDLGAYDLYLRGVGLVELLDRTANEKAIEFFKRAIDNDPNFALAYCGLARAYVEQAFFVDDKSLLDSAVQLCRLAIALDPAEVRGYDQLGRAYYAKGWYAQCNGALEKALELDPEDGRTNALAAMYYLAKHEFGLSYQFFRKAYSKDQTEPRWVYYASKILFGAKLGEVADRWIQQALDRETNPQRHHMMECYRAMWRGQYEAASAGFAQLPPDLKNYDFSVIDGRLACAIGTRDWARVIEHCYEQLQAVPHDIWSRTYLAIAMDATGRQAQAKELAEEIVRRGLERLDQPGQPEVPWDVPLCVAWAKRYLDEKAEGHRYLQRHLSHRTLLHLPLGVENPILNVFRDDSEFAAITADMDAKFDFVREAIATDSSSVIRGLGS